MSFASPFVNELAEPLTLEITTLGFPPPVHPAEADLFARQTRVPGYDMDRILATRVGVIGCGGLGSWIAVGLARAGVQHLTLFDGDTFDRTNAPRQLMFGGDVGISKAHALARNIAPHMTRSGVIRSVADHWGLGWKNQVADLDVLIVGVDSNRARLEASKWGLDHGRPVIFSALGLDGLRAQIFVQRPEGPCLRCVLPDLDADAIVPCAAASVASVFLVAGHAVHAALGVVSRSPVTIWRETALDDSGERVGNPQRQPLCEACNRRSRTG